MCWMCEHPGASQEDYVAYMRRLVQASGWAVQGVERDGPHPPWAYTLGLTGHGRAELVVTGMELPQAARFLNDVTARLLCRDEPRPGTLLRLERDGPGYEVVRLPAPWAHLNLAARMYGRDGFRALQLVHADQHGAWPWQAYYHGLRGGQPVLGPRGPQT